MTFQIIAPDEIDAYIWDRNSLIVDLRDREAYRKKHIKNAVNIPYQDWKESEKRSEINRICKNKKLILYCERGPTSFAVAKELTEKGMEARVMVGGIRAYRGKLTERY